MGKAGGKLCYDYVYDSTWKLEDEIGVGQKPRFSHIDGGTSSFISYVDLKPRYQGLIHGHMKILKKRLGKTCLLLEIPSQCSHCTFLKSDSFAVDRPVCFVIHSHWFVIVMINYAYFNSLGTDKQRCFFYYSRKSSRRTTCSTAEVLASQKDSLCRVSCTPQLPNSDQEQKKVMQWALSWVLPLWVCFLSCSWTYKGSLSGPYLWQNEL